MRFLIILSAFIVSTLAIAESDNPYTELSAAELRSRIAKTAAVYKEKWYQVEVVAFARTTPAGNEYWRLDKRPALSSADNILPDGDAPQLPGQADKIDQSAARAGAWRWLDPSNLTLAHMAKRMASSGNYRILLHRGWRQPMRQRNQAFPIYLSGGRAITAVPYAPQPPAPQTSPTGEGLPLATTVEAEFQASLRVYIGRYLHVEPDLWFNKQSDDGRPYWVQINQKRRMRGEELHYLDHPLFGLLIRMEPYQTNQQAELIKMKEALKTK